MRVIGYVVIHHTLAMDVLYGPFEKQQLAITWAVNKFGFAYALSTRVWQIRELNH